MTTQHPIYYVLTCLDRRAHEITWPWLRRTTVTTSLFTSTKITDIPSDSQRFQGTWCHERPGLPQRWGFDPPEATGPARRSSDLSSSKRRVCSLLPVKDARCNKFNPRHYQTLSHRIHGAGIYANIVGILMVDVTMYIIYIYHTWILWVLYVGIH